jgi:hypothetical protein
MRDDGIRLEGQLNGHPVRVSVFEDDTIQLEWVGREQRDPFVERIVLRAIVEERSRRAGAPRCGGADHDGLAVG